MPVEGNDWKFIFLKKRMKENIRTESQVCRFYVL